MLACDVNLFVEYIFGLRASFFPLYFEISHLMHKTSVDDGKILKGGFLFSFVFFFLFIFEKHFCQMCYVHSSHVRAKWSCSTQVNITNYLEQMCDKVRPTTLLV